MTTLQEFIDQYASPRLAQKAKQSTIYICEQAKTCLAVIIQNKWIGFEQQFRQFKSIIRQLYNSKHTLNHCVRISQIHAETDGYAYSMEQGICDLEDELIANRFKSLFEIVAISYQLCQSIQEVHEMEIIHTDIKLSNFIKFEDQNRTKYKLADFGIAQYFEFSPKSGNGTITAPEQIGTTDYDKTVDIYSLGILFYQMITGERNSQVPQQEVFKKVKPINEQYANIVKGLVEADPQQRFQIQHVMQELQELLNTIQGVTLFGLIKLSFKQDDQSKQWLVTDNYNNKYDTFEITQYMPQDNCRYYSNQKYIRNQLDTYIPMHFKSPHIFNAELQFSIRVDQTFNQILRSFNENKVPERAFIRLIILIVNLQRTTLRKELSGKELNFCIDNSCTTDQRLAEEKLINYEQVLSLILFYFYKLRIQNSAQLKYTETDIENLVYRINNKAQLLESQKIQIEETLGYNQMNLIQRVKGDYQDLTDEETKYIISQIIANSINRNVLINKIINHQKLSNLDLKWLYDDQNGIIQNVEINQYICVDKNNGLFVFARKQQESNWEQIGIDIFKQPLIIQSIDQKQITYATGNMIDTYISQMILLSEYNEQKKQKKHITQVDDGFQLYKVNQDYKFKIHFLDQAIQDFSIDEHEKEKQETDSLTRMCDYLNKINHKEYTTFDQQFRYVFNQIVDLSESIPSKIDRIKQSLTQVNANNPPDFKKFRELVLQPSTLKEQFTRELILVSDYPAYVGENKAKQMQEQEVSKHGQQQQLRSMSNNYQTMDGKSESANLESKSNLYYQQQGNNISEQEKQAQSNLIQHVSTHTFLEFLHQYSNENEQTQQPIQYTQAAIYLCSSSNAIISDFKKDPSFGHDQKAIIKKLYEKSSELKYCTVIKDYFEQGDSFAIAMELGVCDLHEELEAILYKSFFEKMAISLQLLSSIEELHENNIIHSDVKEANFIKFEEGGRIQYKIADFGLCQWINSTKSHYSGCYRAPEVLDQKQYTEFRDHWALGNVFYNLMVNEGHDGYLTEEIAFLKISPINTQFAKIVKSLLSSNPNLRPSIKDVKAQLQGIIDHIEEFYLYNIIELRFTKKQDNEWSIQNNFNIQFDNYTFQFENIRREQKSNKQLEIHDEYLKLDCTSIDIFNCSFRAQIKVDKAFQNLLSQYNNIAQPEQFVKLIFLLVQIQKTIFPDELVSGSQLQFCNEHSGQPLKLSEKFYGKQINCKYLISLILFYFYSHAKQRTQSVKEINKFQINQNHIIKKIINNQILYDQEIKWLYADQQEVINLMKISQQICVDKSNQCFIFTREDDHCHFFTKSAQQLGTNLFKQSLIEMDLKSPFYFICLKNSKKDQDQIHYYSFLNELIKQIRKLNEKQNYLSQVEDAFLIKIDLEKKVSIKLLGQFIIKTDHNQDAIICEYLNNFNSQTKPPHTWQTVNLWQDYLTNQLNELSHFSQSRTQAFDSTQQQQQDLPSLSVNYITDQITQWLNTHRKEEKAFNKYSIATTIVQEYQSIQVIHFNKFPPDLQIQQMKFLKNMNLDYCLNIIEIIQNQSQFAIITELIKDNLLTDISKGEIKALFTKITVMYQLALSLKELHSKGISHQDIKFENFLKIKKDKNVVYKLTGFTKCGSKEGFNQDIQGLSQLYYQILTSDYDKAFDFGKIDLRTRVEKLKLVSRHTNDLINVLVASLTEELKPSLEQIIEALKSILQKVPELQFFKCFKIEFNENCLIDNFGNKYSDYLINYHLLGDQNLKVIKNGSLNTADECIKFNIGNPISNLKATIVLRLDNFILQNLKCFKHLKFLQILDIAAAIVQENCQIMSTQQFQAIMVTKTHQSITYELKEYSVKMLISQMVLLHYYININLLISDKEQKILKEFEIFVNRNPQFFKQ